MVIFQRARAETFLLFVTAFSLHHQQHRAILPGITRDSIMTLAKDMGYEIREENIAREALYLADEVFMTGTAAEIVPVRSVDKITVGEGKRGPIMKGQAAYFGLFNGTTEDSGAG